MRRRHVIVLVLSCGCGGPEPPTVSGVPNPGAPSALDEVFGALTVGGCECKSWQPGVTCAELSYSDLPVDQKYYVTTFGGPGDGQDMWVCGHKTTDNGSWPYLAGYARFGCTKVKVINPANGKSCIGEVADCGPNRCVEQAACFCDCQGHHPVLDVSPFITNYLFGISSSGWSEKRVVQAYPVDPATPIGCPGGPEPPTDHDGDGFAGPPAGPDCNDSDASVHPGAPETCDAVDQNCNGLTDEGLTRPCETLCGTGVESCSNGKWGDCTAPKPIECIGWGSCEVRPFCGDACPPAPPETCNGRDDDCDGLTDEDSPGLWTLCAAGRGACLRFGVVRCAADGIGVECSATPGSPELEVCDGQDNDCDGKTDEGVCIACTPGEIRPCTTPSGEPGAIHCGPDGVFGACKTLGEVAEESSELAEVPPDAADVPDEWADEPQAGLADECDPEVGEDVQGLGRDATDADLWTQPPPTLERSVGRSGGCAGLRTPGPLSGYGPLGVVFLLYAFRRRTKR